MVKSREPNGPKLNPPRKLCGLFGGHFNAIGPLTVFEYKQGRQWHRYLGCFLRSAHLRRPLYHAKANPSIVWNSSDMIQHVLVTSAGQERWSPLLLSNSSFCYPKWLGRRTSHGLLKASKFSSTPTILQEPTIWLLVFIFATFSSFFDSSLVPFTSLY